MNRIGRTASRRANRGPLLCFCAAVLYSLGGLCIKVIPWSGLAINGARNLVALAVVGGYLLFSRHRLRLNRWVLLGAVSVCGTNCGRRSPDQNMRARTLLWLGSWRKGL